MRARANATSSLQESNSLYRMADQSPPFIGKWCIMQPNGCMNMKIEKNVVLRAPRTKVWDALTTEEGWTGWFSEGVIGDFTPGSTLTLDFGAHGLCYALVTDRKELELFQLKWHPGEDCTLEAYPAEQMTTITFRLSDHEKGTLLEMVEDGFESVSDARRAKALELNSEGWRWELVELEAYVNLGDRQLLAHDEVVRERIYAAPIQKVWDAVATPKGWEGWFVKSVEGTFEVGETPSAMFMETCRGGFKIIQRHEPNAFVFKWHPANMEGAEWTDFPEEEATTVVMSLTEVTEGTHLKIIESGFKNVRKEHFVTAMDLNADGWAQCMNMIGDYLNGA